MKKLFCAFLVLLNMAAFCADTEKEKMSYSFGMVIASDLAETGLEFDYDLFIQGFRDAMENQETLFTMEEAFESVESAFFAIQERMNEQLKLDAERNLEEGNAFLEMNAKRPGVEVTPSGLQFEIISDGSGETPGAGDTVLVNYRGTTIDGSVFDSSYERGEPLEVPLYMVIPGWSEGLRMMKEGSRAKLYIPPDLAYGESGAGGLIGPNMVIIFDVEFISILAHDDLDLDLDFIEDE